MSVARAASRLSGSSCSSLLFAACATFDLIVVRLRVGPCQVPAARVVELPCHRLHEWLLVESLDAQPVFGAEPHGSTRWNPRYEDGVL
eukprot:COSAG01_NODE_18415_length_1077_cov_2.403885_1_plen_87_part_10